MKEPYQQEKTTCPKPLTTFNISSMPKTPENKKTKAINWSPEYKKDFDEESFGRREKISEFDISEVTKRLF